MGRYTITGMAPGSELEKDLPYGGSLVVERNEYGAFVYTAEVEARDEDAALDVVAALLGTTSEALDMQTCYEDEEEYGGEADGYRQYGRLVGHVPMGRVRDVREAICLTLRRR